MTGPGQKPLAEVIFGSQDRAPRQEPDLADTIAALYRYYRTRSMPLATPNASGVTRRRGEDKGQR